MNYCLRLLIVVLVMTGSVQAQDVHFSQFFLTPMLTSPANTGNFDGDWRFSANYRSQWKRIDEPYLTQAIALEKQFWLYTEQLSAGLQVVNDKSAGTLQVLKIFGSGAYHKKLNRHGLHAGLQGGYVRKAIQPGTETFPNQFNWSTGAFDPSLPNQENSLGDNLSYVDFNVGAGYDYRFEKITPYVHLSFFHLTTPNETFTGTTYQLPMRKVLNAGARWQFSEKTAAEPSVFLMGTTKASDLVAGSRIFYKLQSNPIHKTELFAGLYYRDGFSRNWDAFFLSAGINYKNYTVGISYDYNVSDLHVATDHRGALEIGFIYKAISTRLKRTIIPCDRY